MILVDDRVGSAELDPLLSSPSVLCRLPYADFAWAGNGPNGSLDVGIERKSLLDLLQSMTSGRLSGHQMIGLTHAYDWVYLLVEGLWRPDHNTGILLRMAGRGKWKPAQQGKRRFMARDVFNFMQTLAVMCGVVVVRTGTQKESARWLDACHGWWQKTWSKHKSHLQFHEPAEYAQLTKPSLVTRVASQFDGVGWDKARKIGDQFPMLNDFMAATVEDLRKLEGIGPRTAESIVEQRDVPF